jgi:hypothetical protein
MKTLNVLSIEQLYAETIVRGIRPKVRCFAQDRVKPGEWLAIHTKQAQDGRMKTVNQILFTNDADNINFDERLGCIVGVVRISSCEKDAGLDASTKGQTLIRFDKAIQLSQPIKFKGNCFIHRLPDDVKESVVNQIFP